MQPLAVTLLAICINHLLPDHINTSGCGVNSLLEEQAGPPRFIGGGHVTRGSGLWPWICSVGFLETDVWEHWCGGALVTYRHVLTAAHCMEAFKRQGSVDRLKVRCGDVHLMDSKDDGGVQVREVVYYDINDG